VSGTKSDPAVTVKMLGDQLAAVATIAAWPMTNPPLGRFCPFEHTAHAKFCHTSETDAVNAKVRVTATSLILKTFIGELIESLYGSRADQSILTQMPRLNLQATNSVRKLRKILK
jgi:hypothetical protein